MNINVNYSIQDFVADAKKTAEIKIGLLYKSGPFLDIIAVILITYFMLTGFKQEQVGHNWVGTLFIAVGIVILSAFISQYNRTKSRKKNLRNLEIKDGLDSTLFVAFTFTEKIFARRSKDYYSEDSWESYESYLEVDEFILIILKGTPIDSAFFVGKKQLYKEEYEELIAFLATKLPVWKR